MFKQVRYFLRFIKIFNKLTQSPSVIASSIDAETPWEKVDADNLSAFYRSKSGQRFVRMMQNIEAENNAIAIMDSKDLTYSAGSAFGGRQMLAHMFALSVTDPTPLQSDEYDSLREPESELDELEELMTQYTRQ